MTYQIYRIRLINGEVIEAVEDYNLPWNKGLIAKYQKAADDELFVIGDALLGYSYIPKKSILYITTGGVRKVTG